MSTSPTWHRRSHLRCFTDGCVVGRSVTVPGTATSKQRRYDWRASSGGLGSEPGVGRLRYRRLRLHDKASSPVAPHCPGSGADKDSGKSEVSRSPFRFTAEPSSRPLEGGDRQPNLVQKGRVVPVQDLVDPLRRIHIWRPAPEDPGPERRLRCERPARDSAENVITVSVSGADSGNTMREQASKYMYNLPSRTAESLPAKHSPSGFGLAAGYATTMYILLRLGSKQTSQRS